MSSFKTESSDSIQPGLAEDAGANVGKIRDILFGGQMREYELRFSTIEQRLFEDLSQLRQEVIDRMGRIEGEVRQELRKLGESVLRERNERLEALHGMDLSMARLGDGLASRIDSVDRNAADKLDAVKQGLAVDLHARFGEVSEQLRIAEQRLGHDKTGREELAGLLVELAGRLSSTAQ